MEPVQCDAGLSRVCLSPMPLFARAGIRSLYWGFSFISLCGLTLTFYRLCFTRGIWLSNFIMADLV